MTKNIVLLSTGGTIASTANEDGRSVAGAMTGEELAQHIDLDAAINLQVISVFQKPSNAITLADLLVLRSRCESLIACGEIDGIVITHGTDTLEDTAYFLDTTLDTPDVPIVITGSQRVPHAMGTDAWVNLHNAILVAASDQCRAMGVLVAFNEMIYAAAFVHKTSSYQVNGFDAPGRASLGLIDNGQITLYQRPCRLPVLPVPDTAKLPDVAIVPVYLDACTAQLDGLVERGVRGIVIEALGRGHVPPAWMPAIRKARQAGVTLVVCSSTLHGPVHQSYTFTGSLHELEEAGAIGISGLTARKIRLRLAVLLAQGKTGREQILAAFSVCAHSSPG